MRIRYLPRAFAELEAVHAYISKRSPSAALRVTTAIRTSIAGLSDAPEMGQLADDPSIRVLRIAHHTYHVYYRIAGDEIEILHIRHTAYRPPAADEQ